MRRYTGLRLSLALSLIVAGMLAAVPRAEAADLDEAYPSPRAPSNGPAIAGGVADARVAGAHVLDPRCRVIPQPETNLYGDTTRFRPTMICMSRGIYADLYKPYPAYHPFYDWIRSFSPFR